MTRLKRWHLVTGALLCLGLGFGAGHSDSQSDTTTIHDLRRTVSHLQDQVDTCVTGVKTRTLPPIILCMYDDSDCSK